MRNSEMNRVNSKYLLVLTTLCTLASETPAWARRVELSLDIKELRRLQLGTPTSASFINFEKITGAELSSLCPTKGFHLQPSRNVGDENVSRSLRLTFSNGRPDVDECIRGQACFALKAEKQIASPNGPTKFEFNGRAGSYKISIDAPAELSRQPVTCKSSAIEILQSARGELNLPRSLWVLNYRTSIVLWDGIEKRPWYSFKLPHKQTFSDKLNVAVDSSGRILISDQNRTFLYADFIADKTLLNANDGLFEGRFGVGGMGYSDEWQIRYSAPFSFERPSKLSAQSNEAFAKHPLFLGLSGFAKGDQFWTWENAFKSLQGTGGRPFSLGAPLISGTERIIDDSAEVYLAVRKSSESADIISYTSGGTSMRTVRTNQRLDERAQNTHFIIIGNELYRHTSDGIYRVNSDHEYPSNLKGFKGSVEPRTHVILTRKPEGKSCSLNVWPVAMLLSGVFESVIGSLGCNSAQGIGVSTWGHSVTWVENQIVKSVLSTRD